MKKLAILTILLLVGGVGYLLLGPTDQTQETGLVVGAVNLDTPSIPSGHFVSRNFFVATTTTATSTNSRDVVNQTIRLSGAKKVDFYFSRGGTTNPNTGSTQFFVQVTPNGDDWYYYGKWEENASSTRAFTSLSKTTAGFSMSGTSTVVASMDLTQDSFYAARCIAIETTDGEHTCKATAEY